MKSTLQLVAVLMVVAVAIFLVGTPSVDAGCGYGFGYGGYCAPCYPTHYVQPIIPVHTCVPTYFTPCYHSFYRGY